VAIAENPSTSAKNTVLATDVAQFSQNGENGPLMKEVALSTAQEQLSELVDDVRRHHDDVIISSNDQPVAALVEIDRYRRMQELEDRFTQLELKAALRGKQYPLEEVLSELGITA
jgi:prevent-host-death family protein